MEKIYVVNNNTWKRQNDICLTLTLAQIEGAYKLYEALSDYKEENISLYNKDDYIDLIDDNIAALEDEITQTDDGAERNWLKQDLNALKQYKQNLMEE